MGFDADVRMLWNLGLQPGLHISYSSITQWGRIVNRPVLLMSGALTDEWCNSDGDRHPLWQCCGY